jgi:hypothetical protein
MDCSVCCNKFNQTTRRLVNCDFCPYQACLSCTKTYILSTIHQPHCMNCRKEWNIDSMNKIFPKTFLRDDYRRMREIILFEEEKTYLPDIQEEAERLLMIKKIDKERTIVQNQIHDNYRNENQLVYTQRENEKDLKIKDDLLLKKRHEYMIKDTKKSIKKFVMKCMKNDCRGFLSESYTCGLCSTNFCKDCHHTIDLEHKCNPDEVATIKELNKTTKPCPKCQIRIFKTDGCDQMFCISCHTAFSWKTGEIELGIIHNPHYFQALREGNINDPRHRQEHGGCGPIPVYQNIYAIYNTSVYRKLLDIYYQQFRHHRQVSLFELTRREDRVSDRLRYLISEMDEKIFKQRLFVHYQHSLRRREEYQILDSFVTIGEELFRLLKKDNIEETVSQLNKLREITHNAFILLDQKYDHAGYIRSKDIFYMFK